MCWIFFGSRSVFVCDFWSQLVVVRGWVPIHDRSLPVVLPVDVTGWREGVKKREETKSKNRFSSFGRLSPRSPVASFSAARVPHIR